MKNPFKTLRPQSAAAESALPAVAFAERSGASANASRQRATGGHTFGKAFNHVKPFMSAALQNFTLVAPVLLIAAVVLSVLSVIQASKFISTFSRNAKSTELNSLSPLVEKKPLIAADYQSAANIIAKNNSAVQVVLSRNRNAITISIKDPALLPEFMYALVTIQSYRQGVAWNATTLCLNKCEGGQAATADITGYVQAISFTGLRTR